MESMTGSRCHLLAKCTLLAGTLRKLPSLIFLCGNPQTGTGRQTDAYISAPGNWGRRGLLGAKKAEALHRKRLCHMAPSHIAFPPGGIALIAPAARRGRMDLCTHPTFPRLSTCFRGGCRCSHYIAYIHVEAIILTTVANVLVTVANIVSDVLGSSRTLRRHLRVVATVAQVADVTSCHGGTWDAGKRGAEGSGAPSQWPQPTRELLVSGYRPPHEEDMISETESRKVNN